MVASTVYVTLSYVEKCTSAELMPLDNCPGYEQWLAIKRNRPNTIDM